MAQLRADAGRRRPAAFNRESWSAGVRARAGLRGRVSAPAAAALPRNQQGRRRARHRRARRGPLLNIGAGVRGEGRWQRARATHTCR